MKSSPLVISAIDQLDSSRLLLATFAALAVLAAVFYQVGFLGKIVQAVGAVLGGTVRRGFLLWKGLLSWASWPIYAAMALGLLYLGVAGGEASPAAAVLCGLALLFLGVTACLAYVFIDLERYEVSRGYKALHSPGKGQELAANLVRYGPRVGIPLLIAATVATVGGFALLNQGLYDTVGRDWYVLRPGKYLPPAAGPGTGPTTGEVLAVGRNSRIRLARRIATGARTRERSSP